MIGNNILGAEEAEAEEGVCKMMSVKVIDRHGFEWGREITTFQYCPSSKDDPTMECVNLFFPDGSLPERIGDGTIYIMNTEGRTIAKYEILPPREPMTESSPA